MGEDMKHTFTHVVFLVIFIGTMLVVAQAKAEPLAVIVNTDNPVNSLSFKKIRMIYHDETIVWSGGKKINAYDLSVKSPERALFSKKIMGKSPDKIAEEWANKKITDSSKNQPRVVSKMELVLYRVKKDKFAIGYVPLSMISGDISVKKVAVVE